MRIRLMLVTGWLIAGGAGVGAETGSQPEAPQALVPPRLDGSPFAAEDVMDEADNADPFADSGPGWGASLARIPMARLSEKRETLQVRLEIWEVDTKAFALDLDGFADPEAVDSWRKQRLADTNSRLVHAPVIVIDAQSRASVEGTLEQIYPTEYEPPEFLPDKAIEHLLAERAPKGLGEVIEQLTAGATPTAFETRNTGLTLEAAVQPVTGEAGCWDLSLAFEEVRLVEMAGHGPEAMHVKMPNFSSFRSGGLLRVARQRWQLVSAMAPIMDPARETRGMSWVSIVRVDPARANPMPAP